MAMSVGGSRDPSFEPGVNQKADYTQMSKDMLTKEYEGLRDKGSTKQKQQFITNTIDAAAKILGADLRLNIAETTPEANQARALLQHACDMLYDLRGDRDTFMDTMLSARKQTSGPHLRDVFDTTWETTKIYREMMRR